MELGTGSDYLAYICKKCGFARPIESKEPLYWVSCKKCQVKRVSKEEGKCPRCD